MSTPEPNGILVVDDNLLFSASLMTALKRLGFRVAIVDTAAQVLTRARAVAPRAVLLNLAARSLDSPARVRELKAAPDLAEVPIVGYCGHMDVALIEAGRAAGCDVVVANSAVAGSLGDVVRRAGVTLPEDGD